MSRRRAKPSDISPETLAAVEEARLYSLSLERRRREREATSATLTVIAAMTGTAVAIVFALHAGGCI